MNQLEWQNWRHQRWRTILSGRNKENSYKIASADEISLARTTGRAGLRDRSRFRKTHAETIAKLIIRTITSRRSKGELYSQIKIAANVDILREEGHADVRRNGFPGQTLHRKRTRREILIRHSRRRGKGFTKKESWRFRFRAAKEAVGFL